MGWYSVAILFYETKLAIKLVRVRMVVTDREGRYVSASFPGTPN